jgi:hypothetical protein
MVRYEIVSRLFRPVTAYVATALVDTIDSFVQVGTLLVVTGAALAAMIQIRHLRASNELAALLTLTDQLRQADLRHAFRFVQTELDERLRDPAFRRELAALGYVDAQTHPEMDVCNWFNQIGTLVKNKLIDKRTFLDLFSRLVTYYWSRLEPAIALLRRERGPGQYENFEYLAVLAQRWHARHPHGAYPANAARMPIADPWLVSDSPPPL